MARPRSAPDVGVEEETAAFLRDLRALRDQAGLPLGELAARAHFPEDALAAAEAGPALPGLPVLEAYVRACGASAARWEDRWRRLSQGTVTAIGLPTRQPAMAKAPARIVPFPGADEREMAGIPPVSAEAMLAAAAEPSVPPVPAPAPSPLEPSPLEPSAPEPSAPAASTPAPGMPPASAPHPAAPAEPSPAQPTVTVPVPEASPSWFEPAARTGSFQPAPAIQPPATASAAVPPATAPPAAMMPPTAPPPTAAPRTPPPAAEQPPAAQSAAPNQPAAANTATGHRAEPEHRRTAAALAAIAVVVVVLAAAVAAWLALHG